MLQAAVGDRVAGRDALDEADQDRQRDADEGDRSTTRLLSVSSPIVPVASATTRQIDGGREDPLEVEVEDRPPGGVALEEDLLSRVELRRHGRQSIPHRRVATARDPAPRPPPALACGAMAIAKVEPLTTARALRGPVRLPLPERLGGVGVGSVLRVPFGRQRLLGVVVELAERSELPPERLAEPIEALEAGAPAGAGAARALGRPRVLLDARARARAGAAARAPTGGSRPDARPATELSRPHPTAAAAALAGEGAPRLGAAAARSSC